MSIYNWLCLLGVPAIVSAIGGYMIAKFKSVKAEQDSIKLGVQALLRADMIRDYNKWMEKGYAPIYAKENFENVWTQYHALGSNGVMDNIHQEFLNLPTERRKNNV